LASTSSVAGMTAVSMICGSLAATAKVWKRARGRSPSEDAFSSLMISTAAAPSEICDEVPAVTVPSPRRPAQAGQLLQRGVAPYPLVDLHQARSPLPHRERRDEPGLDATISLAKRPSSVARAARTWDATRTRPCRRG
jgi:hypothetical protein